MIHIGLYVGICRLGYICNYLPILITKPILTIFKITTVRSCRYVYIGILANSSRYLLTYLILIYLKLITNERTNKKYKYYLIKILRFIKIINISTIYEITNGRIAC